ncbi:MAG: cyanophycin synthetase, partial [Bacteriovoracaceae bacterium]
FTEEGYLYYAVKENTSGRGLFLINNDDRFLSTLENTEGTKRFGKSEESELMMTFHQDGAKLADLSVHNSFITGEHNKSNLVTCAYIAHYFYPGLKEEILKAASSFRPTANRSQWIEVKGSKIFLDAYNANPSSMRVALEGFKEHVLSSGAMLRDCCVVLGDMNELGEHSARYHEETGKYASDLGFEHLIFVGRFAEDYLKGAQKGEKFESATNFKSLYQNNYLTIKKYHFIKGSRSLQLESLFDIN